MVEMSRTGITERKIQTNDLYKRVCSEFENTNFSHEERAYWLSKFVVEIRIRKLGVIHA